MWRNRSGIPADGPPRMSTRCSRARGPGDGPPPSAIVVSLVDSLDLASAAASSSTHRPPAVTTPTCARRPCPRPSTGATGLAARDHRGIAGKSSGGYRGDGHADAPPGPVGRAGYAARRRRAVRVLLPGSDVGEAPRALRDGSHGGSLDAWLADFGTRPAFPHPADGALVGARLLACYSADEDGNGPPPVQSRHRRGHPRGLGSLAAPDPVRMARTSSAAAAQRSLRAIYIDAGQAGTSTGGTRALRRSARRGVPRRQGRRRLSSSCSRPSTATSSTASYPLALRYLARAAVGVVALAGRATRLGPWSGFVSRPCSTAPKGVGTTTFIDIPPDVRAAFDEPPTAGHGHDQWLHLLLHGGRLRRRLLPAINKANRPAPGFDAAVIGSPVDLARAIRGADRRRPDDRAEALVADPEVNERFDAPGLQSPRVEYVRWVTEAKKSETPRAPHCRDGVSRLREGLPPRR